MKVLKVKTLTIPDNDNREGGATVVPLPKPSFTGVLDYDQHQDWLEAFNDPEYFNSIHNSEPKA